MVVSSNRPRVLTPKGGEYNLSGGIWETNPLTPKNVTGTPAIATVIVHGNDEDRMDTQNSNNNNIKHNEDRSVGSMSVNGDENFTNYPDHDDDEDTLVSLDLERIEQLLSYRLLNGYCLLEKACPSCSVPLIKLPINVDTKSDVNNPKGYNNFADNMTTPRRMEASNGSYHYISYSIENSNKVPNGSKDNGSVSPTNQPSIEVRSLDTFDLSGSSNAPIVPIAGVPFCVYCEAHVITNDGEVAIIEEMASAIDARHSGQVFVGASDANNSITTDLLEATRQQMDDNNNNYGVPLQDPNTDPTTDGTVDCSRFEAKDPTPRQNGTFFTTAAGGKSLSLSPRRKKRIPTHPNSLAMTKNTNSTRNTPGRSKSYSPQIKRKGVREPFFFASYDDASRTIDDDGGGDDRFSHIPSFFDESIHRRSVLWPEGTTLNSMRSKANQKFPEGRKLNSNTNAGNNTNTRTSKLEPPSPVVVVLTKEQISKQPNATVTQQAEQRSLQQPPIALATAPDAVPLRVKRDPEPSQSGEETDIDPIIIITSNEQYTVNDAGETVKKERPNPVPSEQPQQQQKRSYTNQQMTLPSVEIPIPQDGMNFDEISTLAHTYDEGSPPHHHHHHHHHRGGVSSNQQLDYFSSNQGRRNAKASIKFDQTSFGNNKLYSDEDDEMMDFPMPEYGTR